ncbi:1-phosphatidylinositol 4,5-bisphosphate phosphodiesterase eta-2-like, partial [Notothenia coriiceps]|uniref:Phosphoinositide phospholipase C n=1 Tax=Notothenia coriiceps TaxID=8208 RepID=A0A6I9P8K2_9TELE
YPVILSIENHCSVPQQKKMAQYLIEILGDKLDVSNIKAEESGRLPSPETLRGKILVKGKKLPPNIDEDAEEGDVSDEDSADEMEDDCKLMNGDEEASLSCECHSVTDWEWLGKKKTMKLSRALSDLVKYTCSVGLYDIEAQPSCSWQVSSLSETKAHQVMQQKATSFIHFNQRQLSRIYPSSYRVDSSNFNPQPFWSAGCQLVALNYQSEGRVLQLNRAKFYSNGNCGYILKPACMCEGTFNPNLEEPLPDQMKKQLVLKIISGQQLPKPKDSMLGDRGEIIDPFVEVEIIGLPVDCCKEQTRVVDDNGFNPMWEETIVFTVHMPELALVRFLVWDHDPIGQDFIGQRTIAFNSMIPGYRHVYLEGMEEASIFVHVAVNDITGKARAATGIKGLFHRNPKQASLDSHAAAQHSRKHPFGAHLLRRTASAPTKGQPKVKKGFPEIAIDTKDYSSEGASGDRESEDRDKASADASHQPTPPQNRESLASHPAKGPWERPDTNGAFHPEKGKDCSTVQKPALLSLHSDAARTTRVIRFVSTPEDSLSSHHSSSSSLQSTAINADHLLAAPSNGAVYSPTRVSGDPKKPTTNSRTTLLPLTPEKTEPSQVVPNNRGADSLMERSPNQKENLTEKKREAAEVKSDHRVKPAAVTEPPRPPAPEKAPARRALFSSMPSHSPVRRTKSEGHVLVAVASTEQSAVPQVFTDATMNDRLWSKLDPASHRDSMSSSSSISSSDTVIDLSLPNLARKTLSSPPTASSPCDPNWINYRHSALVSYDTPQVSKSKSNPNLQQSECPRDELKPRPLQPPEQASVDSPNRLTQRRHTWSRLYMEGLKQSSPSRPSPPAKTHIATASMSKSLGDLTSDDISCNFDSKYRSISRSFIVSPLRDQFRRGSPQKSRPTSHLTEQLRKLTDVEPLTASDFNSETRPRESQENFVDETLMRRTSSRSQSRVRYIANRAKKAQERQRLQGLAQGRSASFNLGCGSLTNPIEERGNPEGACCVAQSPCTSLDLLSQLAPLRTPFPRQPQSPPESSEVFFRLKL